MASYGSPRDGQQVATLADAAGRDGPRSRSRPRCRAIRSSIPGDRDHRRRQRSARAPTQPYGAYLERIGAVGTLRRGRSRVRAGPRRPRATPRGAASRRRPRRSPRVLPEPEAGLAAGILIGLRDRVDRDLAAAFTTAGVSHVVAISGWNIAIVAAAIAAMTGRLGRRRRSVVTIVAIVAYVAFAGGVGVGRAGRAHGRRRAARARDRPRGAGDRGARLGRDAAARQRPEPDRRRRLPALVAGDGRASSPGRRR